LRHVLVLPHLREIVTNGRLRFWRNRPTWRRRRAPAIGRARSLDSHHGSLETAHQTAHVCFSVINSTMTPSRRPAQDCPPPLVLPHGCVCPPSLHTAECASAKLGAAVPRRSGLCAAGALGCTTACLLRARAALAGLCAAATGVSPLASCGQDRLCPSTRSPPLPSPLPAPGPVAARAWLAEPLAPANAPSAAGETRWPAVDLWGSCDP
jgi:hypothetical protein